MEDNQLQRRRKMYFELSTQIAFIDNAQLRSMCGKSVTHTDWGTDHVLSIGRSKVFVKRVPVTDLEYDNLFSTKNLYDLPTYYNYGFGSAGLGVFRELAAHIKTTNWVLEGAIESFPLLYHYRIVPRFGARARVNREHHARYVEFWGNHPNIGKYILDRANANFELVLFLEYIPYMAEEWLLEHAGKIPMIIDDMWAAITFLMKYGIIHLDTDFSNVLTDGRRAYLTDFGLVLDKQFTLSAAEQKFYKQNSYYDYGNLLWSLGSQLVWLYRGSPDVDKRRISKKCGISDGVKFEQQMSILLDNFDELYSSGILKLDKSYFTSLMKYRNIITFMHEFYSDMRGNSRKDKRFNNESLRRLLKDAALISSNASNG